MITLVSHWLLNIIQLKMNKLVKKKNHASKTVKPAITEVAAPNSVVPPTTKQHKMWIENNKNVMQQH